MTSLPLLAGCIGSAAVVAEGDTRNEGQPFNLKGSLAELKGGRDVRRQLREGVEGTLGRDEGDSVNRLKTLAEQLAPMVVALGHGVDAVPRTLKSSQGTALGKAADIARALALQCSCRLDHRLRTGQITQAPSGHGPSLGEAVDGEAAFP